MKIRDKKTGKIHSFGWDGPSPPTAEQIRQIVSQQQEVPDFSDVESGTSAAVQVQDPSPAAGPKVNLPPVESNLGKSASLIERVLDAPKQPLLALGSKIAGTEIENFGEAYKNIFGVGDDYQESEAGLPNNVIGNAIKSTPLGSIGDAAARLLPKNITVPKGLGLTLSEDKEIPFKAPLIGFAGETLSDPTLPAVGAPGRVLAGAGSLAAGLRATDAIQSGDPLTALTYGGLAALGAHGMREAPRVNIPEVDIPRVNVPEEIIPPINIPEQRYNADGSIYNQIEQSDNFVTRLENATKAADSVPEPIPSIEDPLTWPVESRGKISAGEPEPLRWDIDGPKSPLRQVQDLDSSPQVELLEQPNQLQQPQAMEPQLDVLQTLDPVSIDSRIDPNLANDNTPQIDPGELDNQLLRELAAKNNVPVDPLKLDPVTRSNLIKSLGGEPNVPPPVSVQKSRKKVRKGREKFQLDFPEWVNRRSASELEGKLKGREFADLDMLGQQAIFDIQSRSTQNPRYSEVRKYLDSKFAELKKSGSKVSYKENYLPQLWEDDPDTVFSTFKKLGLKPTLEMKSVFKNYEEGIKAGLTPKFTKVSDLTKFYERQANKAIADRGFFNMLRTMKAIGFKDKVPKDWVALDPNVFPISGFKKKGVTQHRVYAAPREVADIIHNYLRDPGQASKGYKALDTFAKGAGHAKNWVLSSGVPGTGLNMQGIKTLASSTLASKNPFKGFAKTASQLANPKWAKRELEDNIKDAPRFMRAGMKFSAEDFGLVDNAGKSIKERLGKVKAGPGGLLKKVGKGVHEVHAHLFEDPMYQGILPAAKLRHAKMIESDLLQKGVDPEEALSTASHAVNEIFGGINLDELGRSKEFQNILRSTLLAPDHYESQIKLAGKMARGLRGRKKDLVYRRMTRNLIGAYALASIGQKIATNKWMHENPEGKKFSINLGQTANGKTRYLRPFGTSIDFARVPYEIVESLAKGNIGKSFSTVKNRLSVPLASTTNILANQDWRGKKLYGENIPKDEQILNVGGEVANVFLPTYGQATSDYLTGDTGAEEAIAQGLELPFHYQAKKKRRTFGIEP